MVMEDAKIGDGAVGDQWPPYYSQNKSNFEPLE